MSTPEMYRWDTKRPVACAADENYVAVDVCDGCKKRALGVMLHEGKMFGPLNQIIILLVCLMILLGSVSGLVMWWKRRPEGGLGVPPLRHDLPRWKTAVGVMLVLGVMFPMVGVSMVVMWVVDSLVVKRRRVLASA